MDNRNNSGNTRRGGQLVPASEERALRDFEQTQEILRAYPVEEDEVSILKYFDVVLRRKKVI